MASVTGTFVPTYQGLSARHFVRPVVSGATPFPFNAAHRLPYYRARNAIYHLFRALLETNPSLSVLVPDYYSGNEIMAIQAAGARIHYCPVGPDMQWDPAEVDRLCRVHNPDLLYVIHYVGWPQPMAELTELCRRREMLLVEDCALSLLSEDADGRALGTFGQWSVFCLYKTLPLPNGALLVQNDRRLESLERLTLRRAGSASVLGRTAELLVQRIRGRANGVGAALQAVKARHGSRGRCPGRAARERRRHRLQPGRGGSRHVAAVGAAARSTGLRRDRPAPRGELSSTARAARSGRHSGLPGAAGRRLPALLPDHRPGQGRGGGRAARAASTRSSSGTTRSAPATRCRRTRDSSGGTSSSCRFTRISHRATSHMSRGRYRNSDRRVHRTHWRRNGACSRSQSRAGRSHRKSWRRLDRQPASRLTVECIDSSWGFTALRPEWNALLRASASDCPFLTWEWLHTWWTHLGGSSRLRIAAVRAGQELVALAPFRVTEEPGRVPVAARHARHRRSRLRLPGRDRAPRVGSRRRARPGPVRPIGKRDAPARPPGADRQRRASSRIVSRPKAGPRRTRLTACVPISRWPVTRGIRTWRRWGRRIAPTCGAGSRRSARNSRCASSGSRRRRSGARPWPRW